MDIGAIVEFVGTDVLLLGTVTILAWHLAKGLWQAAPRSLEEPNGAQILAGFNQGLKDAAASGIPSLVALVVVATVAGMLMNETADHVLDSDTARWLSSVIQTFWPGEEDHIKTKALGAVIDNLRGPYPDVASRFGAAADDQDATKALLQVAEAKITAAPQAALATSIRSELLVVKLLRTLWLVAVALFLVTLAAIMRRSTTRNVWADNVWPWWLAVVWLFVVAENWGRPLKDEALELWTAGTYAVLGGLALLAWRSNKRLTAISVGLFVFQFVVLGLWADQSDRYYKKVFYAYASTIQAEPMAANALPPGIVHTGACDGSAAVLAPNSDLFVSASDEDNVLRAYSLSRAGAPVFETDLTSFLGAPRGREVDIEGAAAVGDLVFWIGSHGTNKDGRPRAERQRLFATAVSASSVQPRGKPYEGLLRDLISAPTLAALNLRDFETVAPAKGGVNIEGLAKFGADQLLLGLRSPLDNGKAVLIPVENPAALVTADATSAAIGAPIRVDLGGLGIRSLEYVDTLGEYLIVAGPVADKGKMRLYQWRGPGHDPVNVADLGSQGLNVEGLFVRGASDSGILVELVTDEGDVKTNGTTCKDGEASQRAFRSVPVTVPRR